MYYIVKRVKHEKFEHRLLRGTNKNRQSFDRCSGQVGGFLVEYLTCPSKNYRPLRSSAYPAMI